MIRKPIAPRVLTPMMKHAFLARLRRSHNISMAARECGINRGTIYYHMNRNAEFKEEVLKAKTRGYGGGSIKGWQY